MLSPARFRCGCWLILGEAITEITFAVVAAVAGVVRAETRPSRASV